MAKAKLPVSRAKTAYGLLSEVCRVITEEPRRYNQRIWIDVLRDEPPDVLSSMNYPACGTVACVAGWVATLKRRRGLTDFTTAPTARRVLGLSQEQGDELFDGYAGGNDPSRTPEHARSGVQHIRRFQQKYRAQLLAKKV